MKVDVLEFLKTGQFGPLVHGLRIEEVERLLGPPWDTGEGLTGIVWMYGSLDFWSYKGILESVIVNYKREFGREPFKLPDCLELAGPQLSRRTTLKQFRALLSKEGISYTEHDFRPFEESIHIILNHTHGEGRSWFFGKSNLLRQIWHCCEIPDQS